MECVTLLISTVSTRRNDPQNNAARSSWWIRTRLNFAWKCRRSEISMTKNDKSSVILTRGTISPIGVLLRDRSARLRCVWKSSLFSTMDYLARHQRTFVQFLSRHELEKGFACVCHNDADGVRSAVLLHHCLAD